MDCFYCEKSPRLYELMVPVCELEFSSVYMLKNQNYPGRCVVAFNQHKAELYELTEAEMLGFFGDLAKVAKAIKAEYPADKINYGMYGDTVPHLHCHLVPKTEGCLGWGGPFDMGGNPNFPTDEEMAAAAAKMKAALGV